jgi:RimJ/RimL family protein N-acetyltransferase
VSELRTERLLLRRWRVSDRAPFAALNADPEVTRYFPQPLTRQASDRLAERADAGLEQQGWGIWALEELATGRFLGFTGLAHPSFEAPFTPAVELGWRLARAAWGVGFATEAARAAAAFAFDELDLDELVSYTAEPNVRSRAVMRRLGMRHDPADDFDHPHVPEGDLRRHVLYRQTAPP